MFKDFEEELIEVNRIKKEGNGFKKGDIVKIKEDFLDDTEDGTEFFLVKYWGVFAVDLVLISKENLELPFTPMQRVNLKYIQEKIYGNVVDGWWDEELNNTL